MKSNLVLYHANCADGYGAAFAAWRHLGESAEYIPVKYGEVEYNPQDAVLILDGVEVVIEGRRIMMLDFSVPKDMWAAMAAVAETMIMYDHHKTAFEEYLGQPPASSTTRHKIVGDNSLIVLDNGQSGALLTWTELHGKADVPHLFKVLDDYDRWQFALPDTKALNRAIWSYAPWSFEQWEKLFMPIAPTGGGAPKYQMQKYVNLRDRGEALLGEHMRQVEDTVAVAMPCRLPGGLYGLCANAPPSMASDLGHKLAVKSGAFGMVWRMAQPGVAHVSLRSEGDYDVAAIAKQFGGGGHKNAAGFSVPVATLLEWVL